MLSIKEEHAMLSQAICQPTFPYGLNLKLGYFCIHNFFIYDCSKLWKWNLKNLVWFSYLSVWYWSFVRGFPKNWRINVIKCFANWHWLVIDCPIPNFISTFKELACQCPIVWLKSGFHPFFLCPWSKWKKVNDIWFTTYLIGHN